MNVEVTPDARFELIFDPTVGDILEGSGQGNVTMEVTPAGDGHVGRCRTHHGELLVHIAERGEQAL